MFYFWCNKKTIPTYHTRDFMFTITMKPDIKPYMKHVYETLSLCLRGVYRILWTTHKRDTMLSLAFIVFCIITLPTEWLMVCGWFLAGILSTCGLGSGIHTGVLFLMPYVGRVAIASNDGFLLTFLRVLPASVAHGTGATLGELPPYLMAEKLVHTMKANSMIMSSHEWMVHHVRKWGWPIICLTAMWPSAFFDVCGLACGVVGIPKTTFLSATFVGKALVKSPLITATIVAASKNMLPDWVESMVNKKDHGSIGPGSSWTVVVSLLTVWMLWKMMVEFADMEKAETEKKRDD